jgi:diguanylate cyclase (GGDEF)-like protein
MKDVSFYEIILTRDDGRIVSADSDIYDMLGSYAVKPLSELIAIEDIDIYNNNIANCDGNWYPSKIISPDTMYYTYIRARADNDNLVRLTVVNAKDLLNAHSSLMKAINAFKAQLDLYEDVYFEYDPQKDSLYVYSTELADFDSGTYTLSDFESFLLARADEEQKQDVKGFISQVKSGVGRSTTVIDGNILNDDRSITQTVLEEAFIVYDKETEGVVGHIQLRSNKENFKAGTIKYDSLTGLVDKTDIIRIARERIDDRRLEGTGLVIIDIDYFKSINDTYGHQFGDEVIKKIADIISNEVGDNGITGRFGGDEFFAVLYNLQVEEQLRSILRSIKNKVSATFPDKGIDKDNPLSVSIGAAVFSKDADNYEDLFMLADHSLYLAKEKGRNRYVIYNVDRHGTLEDVKLKHQTAKKINERDFSYGDVIVRMFDMTLHDDDSSLENYMSEFAEAFELDNVLLFVGEPFSLRCAAGSRAITDQVATEVTLGILNSDIKDRYFTLGEFVVVNSLETLPPHAHNIRVFLEKREVYSMIIVRFHDMDKREAILIISTVGRKNQWNQTHYKYYRAFADLLSLHSLGAPEGEAKLE